MTPIILIHWHLFFFGIHRDQKCPEIAPCDTFTKDPGKVTCDECRKRMVAP